MADSTTEEQDIVLTIARDRISGVPVMVLGSLLKLLTKICHLTEMTPSTVS